MSNPLPLNPESPDVQIVDGPAADLVRSIFSRELDTVLDAQVTLPDAQSMEWAQVTLDCARCTWTLDEGGLDAHLTRPISGDVNLDRMFNVLNQPARFDLRDGGRLTARLAHVTNRREGIDLEKKVASATYKVELDSWTWWPQGQRHLWLGRTDVPRVDDGNLVVCGKGWSATNLRLTGNYELYIVENRKAGKTTLVVDTRGRELDQALLGTDFMALEFAMGRPLRLDYLIAVDERHEVVGATGLEFGSWTTRTRTRRCPVAVGMDLYANYGESIEESLWIPPLFTLLAQRLHADGPDSALLTAVAAYLDSVAAGNIHVSYLLVQIALEALCSEIVRPTSGVLVANPKQWLAFVEEHAGAIRALATDSEAGEKLLNKVRSAQNAPSTDRVVAALRHFILQVPEVALKEIGRRNSSAHKFVMAKESTADVQELADRLAVVQTLLVAVVARHIGFNGPIVGWEWIRGRHKIPDDWWTWERLPEARRKYLVLPAPADAAKSTDRLESDDA